MKLSALKVGGLLAALLALLFLLASCCCCCSALPFRGATEPPTPPRFTPPAAPTPLPPPTVVLPPSPPAVPTPLTPPAAPTAGSVRVGETVSGELSGAGDTDIWLLDVEEPVQVTIDLMAENGTWDPVLEVWEPEGVRVAEDDDGGIGFDPRLSQLSLAAGTYELWVRSYGDLGGGPYTLRVAEAGTVAEGASSGGTIRYGETVEGVISSAQPENQWTFAGQAGDVINISMVGQGGFDDTYLELYGPDGSYLTSDDDSGQDLFALITGYVLPESGTYTIVARPYGDDVGIYELTLEQLDIEEHTIAYGETVSGELTAGASQALWFFEGTVGDVVNISMAGQEGMDINLELYSPGGEYLTSGDPSGIDFNALSTNPYILPESGTYRITVYSYSGGEYELYLIKVKEPTIAYGQTLAGELTAETQHQSYLFAGAAGDVVSISMVGLGDLQDTYLELFDLDGTLLVADDDGGKDSFALIGAVTLPYSGTYRIVASSREEVMPYDYPSPGTGLVGRYRLSLRRLEERAIAYGQTLSGRLGEEERCGAWSFTGAAGDLVSISMTGQAGFEDTYLELYGPDGFLLAADDDSGEGFSALIDGFTLPASATYHVIARGYDGGIGSYWLALRREVMQEQPIAYGETAAGELVEAGERDYYRFAGQAGDIVTISMTGLERFADTYLELYGPDGILLATDDDGGEGLAALIDGFRLPTDGTYRIVARAFSGERGPYELTLEGGD